MSSLGRSLTRAVETAVTEPEASMPDYSSLVGRETTESHVVTPAMSADAAGNPGLHVLSTPSLVMLLERTAMAAMDAALGPGERSVGASVDIRHLAPTLVGETVEVTARVESVDGRLVTFSVAARDPVAPIADGRHVRAVIDEARFRERLRQSREASA